MKVIKITETEYQKILEIDKKNRNNRVDQKLRVLKLRYEGASNREISLRTGYNERYITKLIGDYAKQGLEEFLRIKHTSHYRLLEEAEEAEILAKIEEEAEAGTILTIGVGDLPLSSPISQIVGLIRYFPYLSTQSLEN